MAHGETVPLTFRVTVDRMPEGAAVFVAGNQPALGVWRPDAVALQRQDDGAWVGTVHVDRELPVQFKVTRGSWETEAIGEDGAVPPDFIIDVTEPRTVEVHVANWKDSAVVREGGVTGTLLFHRGLEGSGIRPRDVAVWLPPGYDVETDRRYPVLYMHDGQNCFDPATSAFGHEWRMDEEADRLIREGAIEPMIIVGVWNTPDRAQEYGEDPTLTAAYIAFLRETLKPLIDSTYRTKPDAANTAVMGSSMGGLISFLMAWDHPDVYSKAGCLSPAFIRSDILERVAASDGTPKPIRLYLDNGGIGLEAVLQPGCDRMLELLRSKGYAEGSQFQWFLDATAEHNEQAWSARVWRPLTFLFGAAP